MGNQCVKRVSKSIKIYLILFMGMMSFSIAFVATGNTVEPPFEIVAEGLNNPRGLAFGPEGALYITEAGSGGDAYCIDHPVDGPMYFGHTGAITRVWKGQQTQFVSGLPSLAEATGINAFGPQDISFLGRGQAYIVYGLGFDPAVRDNPEYFCFENMPFGQVLRMTASGNVSTFVDLADYEAFVNPDGTEPDSNPNSILVEPNGIVIADAGANDVIHVSNNGSISTLAVFPQRIVTSPPVTDFSMSSVPTTITRGPDGAYYVGELTGFPFPVGGANIYRLIPGEAPEVFATGFTNIIDIAFAEDGTLYVLEIATNSLLSNPPVGAVIQVAPDGTRTTIASDGLNMPTGLAIGPDGALYISNCGICPGEGHVVRIEPGH